MHSLKGVYIKKREPEVLDETTGKMGFPLKLVFSKKRARILFFDSAAEKEKWTVKLKEVAGTSDILDFYQFNEKLGEGQFGVVFKAQHKTT